MTTASRHILHRHRVVLCAVLVTLVSYLTYVPGYNQPSALFWDENYHIASAQHYLNRDFFMEPHPPLGKLLIALGEYALHPNERFDQFRDTDHGKGDLLPAGFSFSGYRLIPTLLAWLTAPLIFLTAWLISKRISLSLLTAALYTFDNAIIVHARAAMLEGTQLFFVIASLLSFFALQKGAVGERYRVVVAGILGAALGAAIATKVNALLFVALIPLLFTIPGTLRSRLATSSCAVVVGCVVYTATWYTHFAIAVHRNDKLKESGYYTTDQAVRQIIDRRGTLGARDFLALMKASAVDYLFDYSKGVPTLDLCKTGENGSPAFLWPVGARTIQYRWETAGDNEARYLYLVPNPAGWLLGAVSLVLAGSLLLGGLVGPQITRPKNMGTILLLLAFYGGYMLAVGRIPRVMYLYHYFIPLLITFLLAAAMAREIEHVGPVIATERRKALFASTYIGCLFLCYLWYSPFTYYKPISDRELASRALLPIWDMKCAGCPRTNFLASGGPPTIFTPRFAVSGVKPTIVKQGWGQPRLGVSVNGKDIEAAGVAYPASFGMHSDAVLSYPVKGRFQRITGHAGMPDYTAQSGGSVIFIIEGDGRVLWKSPVVRGGEAALDINVPIPGVDTVTLRINDAGDGITHDHGFWSDLRFEGSTSSR